ncbi:hypothetical protein C0Q70_02363 [Pomacea canaliculata]|uniref:Uncharacterized protein n=1 Tax=Pomacea canaliculata TaxID=400727 RepID=A0A2T7PPQ1_POMCA|nr:hypothetical protein C0Q70_02363 [Pomacea canaliculata]
MKRSKDDRFSSSGVSCGHGPLSTPPTFSDSLARDASSPDFENKSSMEGNVDVFGVGGEEEEIMDYDDGDDLNFSTDSEEEYEKNSDKQQEYPKTPEERITWQEHIRMIHLRSHLNQLAEKLKHAFYNVEKIREELKKCRTHKRQLQSERDSLFKQMEEQESNKAAIYRLRAAHKRVCSELDEEEKLERTIQEQVEKAEYDLALVEAEKGKFILVEEELLQKEQQLAKEKMQSAHVRQQKEQRLAVTARITRMKETRQKAQLVKEEQQRHCKAIKDAERSHEQASKYLKKTLEKMKKQQEVEQERYQCEMQRKMDMLDNMKVIRARDKALELERQLEEAAEYQRILDEGGNADQQLNIKKRLNDQAEKKKMFEEKQLEQSTFILNNIIYEEKQLQKRKKQQPQLWNEPAWEKTLRVAPHKQKPVKLLEDYINSSYGEVKGGPELRDMTFKQEDEKQDKEKVVQEDELRIHDSTDSSDDEAKEARGVNLAVPEFEGLWEQQILPPKVTKDVQTSSKRPGASKMDKEILEKVLKKHREHIVVKQIAVGREFHGCSFNSKPEVIHFKDIDVGKTYKKKVVLTNVSYTVNYCRYTGMTERLKDFIKVKFDPPGQMSAGMTCNLVVTFKPMINESLFGEINFLSQTGPFSIPLHCTIKKCDLHLDVDQVDFGTAVIGETLKRSITLSNLGGLGTKFDFFKVTGMKQHTFTTGETSLGRLTSDSLHGVSADSEVTPEKVGQQGLFDIAEDLQEVPVSTEVVQQTSEILQAEGSELADTAAVDTEVLADSEKMGPRELPEGASPDLAVSEVDCNLDGMRVGSVTTGEIGPLSSVQLDIIWHPTIPGQVQSEFLVTFADTQATSLAVSAIANGIDVPVWVERQSVDLKICVFDRLYQDTIIINNRATTALKLKFEVCRELHNYMEILPRTGYIQAQSQFSTQLKFLPRKSLAEDSKKYFDAETGVLEAPVLIFVADQTNPVSFAVQAVVTNSDMEFDVQEIDFGHCTVYESVCTTIQLTNKSILPQHYGFLGLPEETFALLDSRLLSLLFHKMHLSQFLHLLGQLHLENSPLHAVATASLLRQFEATVSTVVIPCYIASREPSGKLSHSIENTLYLEVRCPVVKPQLIVISDSGKTTVDFSEVSIGQSTYRSVTIQNISDKMVKLSSTILDTLGPFVLVNALRVLAPEATHTLIISFTPTAGHIFQEPLQVKTGTSSLHLMLVGRGVSPVVRLSVENQLLDMGPVLVNEYVEKSFKVSEVCDECVQNYNGQNVFDVVPAEGTIPPGETKDIMVTFAPDHESIHYSDGIHIELFSEKESHFFQVTGESQKTLLFIVGGDALYPDVESLGVLSHSSAEEVSTPVPFLLTLKSQMRNEEFVPATATIFVCCARSVSTNQKKNGEFQFEGTQQLLQKGINIEPSKAMVEAGIKKPVVITWTPPQGHNSSKVQEELVTVTLRGDVVEQQQFVLHLLVVSA